MPTHEPFGTNESTANPNLGVQKFLGLTVVSFSCNSSWDDQGGQCSIELIQDPDENESLQNVLVGSPQYFEIVDLNGNAVFRFYGILSKLSRSSSSNSKQYTAILQSPVLLLRAASVITEGFAGDGGAYEAYGPNILSKLDFGSRNWNVNSANIFNIFNPFGFYENNEFGDVGSGFGGSAITSDGIRIDYFSNAIDKLVNGEIGSPTLGGNIIYGASSYNSPNAYAYNFDIVGFLSSIASNIPPDYRVKASNLMEFVQDICHQINHVFYVDLLKPQHSGNAAFASGHTSTKTPTLSHANTIYGGQIVVITQNRNVSSNVKFPLSKYIINKEISHKGGSGQINDLPLDIGLSGSFHPDGPPSGSSSAGVYPVEELPVEENRMISSNVSVNLNEDAVGAKVISGGYQSRINYIKSVNTENASPPSEGMEQGVDSDSSHDVYHYWGDIDVAARNTISPNSPLQKMVPVLTPLISPYALRSYSDPNSNVTAMNDIIAIDCIDIVGRLTSSQSSGLPVFWDGIYLASLQELYAASVSYDQWEEFMQLSKGKKYSKLESIFSSPINTKFRSFNGAAYNYLSLSVGLDANHWGGLYNTKSTNIGNATNCSLDPEQMSFETVTNILVEKLAFIYNECYGRQYAVKVPIYSVKVNLESTPSNVADYITPSWTLSQDAFLDPSKWDEYLTPQGDFISNGRIRAYANFETNSSTHREVHCNSILSPTPNSSMWSLTGNKFFKDFSEYGQSKELYSRPVFYAGVGTIVSVPLEVNNQYLNLPVQYFSMYSPHTSLGPILTKVNSGFITDIDTEMQSVREFLSNLILSHSDVGGIPFAIVSLQAKVYSTAGLDQSQIAQQNPLCFGGTFPSFGNTNGIDKFKSMYAQQLLSTGETSEGTYWPSHPIGFGIPQQSNRYVYGPWVTNTTVKYGSKITYEQIESLVPENYINIQTLNDIGQLMADSVEDFDFLYVEEGNLSIAGAPEVTSLGQSLVENGPLVSDISLNISASELVTNYGMKTFAPKFGRLGKYYVDKITSLISRLRN